MSVAANIKRVKDALPVNVSLVAVSKFHAVETLREAYDAGQRIFGESRAQELKVKHQALPNDIEWHFIGQLQSNKVKDIAPFISMIHSIDSLKLLEEVNKQAAKNGRVINVLLEIHVAKEETKTGLSPDECKAMLATDNYKNLSHIRICGLMAMASFTDNTSLIQKEFSEVRQLFSELKESFFAVDDSFSVISMGMSSDYELAIAEGSTMVRVGSSIFGGRS
jgi:pyridoxal phosphate enzyme, YggS family